MLEDADRLYIFGFVWSAMKLNFLAPPPPKTRNSELAYNLEAGMTTEFASHEYY